MFLNQGINKNPIVEELQWGYYDIDVRLLGLLDPVDVDAKLERLSTGFKITEGALSNAESECLLISDIPASQIKK